MLLSKNTDTVSMSRGECAPKKKRVTLTERRQEEERLKNEKVHLFKEVLQLRELEKIWSQGYNCMDHCSQCLEKARKHILAANLYSTDIDIPLLNYDHPTKGQLETTGTETKNNSEHKNTSIEEQTLDLFSGTEHHPRGSHVQHCHHKTVRNSYQYQQTTSVGPFICSASPNCANTYHETGFIQDCNGNSANPHQTLAWIASLKEGVDNDGHQDCQTVSMPRQNKRELSAPQTTLDDLGLLELFGQSDSWLTETSYSSVVSLSPMSIGTDYSLSPPTTQIQSDLEASCNDAQLSPVFHFPSAYTDDENIMEPLTREEIEAGYKTPPPNKSLSPTLLATAASKSTTKHTSQPVCISYKKAQPQKYSGKRFYNELCRIDSSGTRQRHKAQMNRMIGGMEAETENSGLATLLNGLSLEEETTLTSPDDCAGSDKGSGQDVYAVDKCSIFKHQDNKQDIKSEPQQNQVAPEDNKQEIKSIDSERQGNELQPEGNGEDYEQDVKGKSETQQNQAEPEGNKQEMNSIKSEQQRNQLEPEGDEEDKTSIKSEPQRYQPESEHNTKSDLQGYQLQPEGTEEGTMDIKSEPQRQLEPEQDIKRYQIETEGKEVLKAIKYEPQLEPKGKQNPKDKWSDEELNQPETICKHPEKTKSDAGCVKAISSECREEHLTKTNSLADRIKGQELEMSTLQNNNATDKATKGSNTAGELEEKLTPESFLLLFDSLSIKQ